MKNGILSPVDERQNLPGFVLNQTAALGNMAGQERLQKAVFAMQQEHKQERIYEKRYCWDMEQ